LQKYLDKNHWRLYQHRSLEDGNKTFDGYKFVLHPEVIVHIFKKQGSNVMRIGAVYGDHQMLDLSAAYSLYLQDKESAPRREEVAAALLPRDGVAFCDGLPQTLSRAETAIAQVKSLAKNKNSRLKGILSDKGYYL